MQTTSTTHPVRQDLRCVGCGVEGRMPTIVVWDKSKDTDPRPILRPVWAWNERYILLCTDCRADWSKRRTGR